MTSKCFVPNCNNAVGVSFPKHNDLKTKWLDILNIKNVAPTADSFICLEHFDKADIKQNLPEDAQPQDRLKRGATPCAVKLQPTEELKNVESKEDKEEPNEHCRLCLSQTDVSTGISDVLIVEKLHQPATVAIAIEVCLPPLEVNFEDGYSKKVCTSCVTQLRAFYKFKIMCLEVDCKRRLDANRKRKLISGLSIEPPKKLKHEESPPPVVIPRLPEHIKIMKTTKICAATKKAIDKKFDQVEDELRRVLEGKLTKEQISAENIIIAVTSDDEGEDRTQTKVVLPVKEPQEVTEANEKLEDPLEMDDVKLPKCIRIKARTKYLSDVGIYKCTPRKYICDYEFSQVEGYLLENRLEKSNVRYLRCITPACCCTAVQNSTGPGQYSDEVQVQTPHNHQPSSSVDLKKEMFYHVMKRRMQGDKTLNFRHVYEELCAEDPEIKTLVPLRNVINEMCRQQLSYKAPKITSFDCLYDHIEDDSFQKLHFTISGKQFYQERFVAEDASKAIVFSNCQVIQAVSDSKLMYVDASFKIDLHDCFEYQLVTVLVWIDESYYPILFALVSQKTQEIYKKIFEYLHNTLAPDLRPDEIVTDYEANLYYALGETYLDSHIGGSVFYYTQNLYKKICTLKLARELEVNSYFRNIYHMLLMLPLLPVNTILDGLNNIEVQARELGLTELTRQIFEHVRQEWIIKVTPDLFCVHRLESRINENVIAPFKKLRDYVMLSKSKTQKNTSTIVHVVEKLIELESFLQQTYSAPSKRSFARDLSCSQKKNVLKAWQFIENHPKININNFFTKVLGYIRCMENQLWIWGFYRYSGEDSDDLINATNFSIVSNDVEIVTAQEEVYVSEDEVEEKSEQVVEESVPVVEETSVIMEAVIDENGGFVLEEEGQDTFRILFKTN